MSSVLARVAETWRPAPVSHTVVPDSGALGALADLLDLDLSFTDQPAEVPPLWHWLAAAESCPQAQLGEDGHRKEGHFLPRFDNRRRMMAGGRLELFGPMHTGVPYVRESVLSSVDHKVGRTGEMLFTTVRHTYLDDGTVAAIEEEDVVYRDQDAGQARSAAPTEPPRETAQSEPDSTSVAFPTDPVKLFRFSALTYNAHRIHYDQPYATGVEGYPGVVVHGPLLAMLLLEVPRRADPDRRITSLSYRLVRPAFCGTELRASGRLKADNWTLEIGPPEGRVSATASVTMGPR